MTRIKFKNNARSKGANYIVFTAPKTKTYKFTFYNMHAIGSAADSAEGTVNPYYVVGKKLKPYRFTNTTATGLQVCSDNFFRENFMNWDYEGYPSEWMSTKLKKGQKIYFNLGANTDSGTWVSIDLEIK